MIVHAAPKKRLQRDRTQRLSHRQLARDVVVARLLKRSYASGVE